MFEIGYDGLHQLLEECMQSAQYARLHYDELAAQEIEYTLYGPDAHDIAAWVPSKLTPAGARKLLQKTRRKDYMVYSLDKDFNPVRTTHMLNYDWVDCTYYHFKRNGVDYAYPFRGTGSGLYNDTISAVKKENDRYEYYAIASRTLLFVQFYEYLSDEIMEVSTYRYWPTAKYTMHGYPVDRNAPIGALNSPIQRHCYKEAVNSIDFSRWITNTPTKKGKV